MCTTIYVAYLGPSPAVCGGASVVSVAEHLAAREQRYSLPHTHCVTSVLRKLPSLPACLLAVAGANRGAARLRLRKVHAGTSA